MPLLAFKPTSAALVLSTVALPAVAWILLGEFHVTAAVTVSGCIGGLAFYRVAIRS